MSSLRDYFIGRWRRYNNCIPSGFSFRYYAMHTLADEADLCDLHLAQFRFGGDVLLERGSELTRGDKSQRGEEQHERDERETRQRGLSPSKREPGKRRRETDGGGEVRPTARVDRQVAFARVESRPRFGGGRGEVFGGDVCEDEEARGVGMSRHGDGMSLRHQVEGGVFKRMVSAGFENKREVE